MPRNRSLPRPQTNAEAHPGPTSRQQRRPHRPRGGPARGPASGRQEPTHYPVARLLVTAWPDPVLDALGHDPRSPYVEQFWLSILGPSVLMLMRRLAARLEVDPGGFELHPDQWAAELGLGSQGGHNGPFWRTVDRTCRFGAAERNGELLAVKRRLAPLTSRQAERLPLHLRPVHERWQAAQLERPRRRTIAHWSDHRAVPPPV